MEDKYQEIIEGSKKIFLKYGIRSVSMDDIAAELGISKKTIYHFFNNKAHLVEAILDYLHEKGEKMEICFREQKLNAIDTILEVSKFVNNRMIETHPLISFELKKYYPEIFNKQIERTRNHTFIHVRENLEQGIREGLYRKDLDVELVASLYIKDMETMFDEDFYSNKQFSFSKVFEVMFEKYIRGIANENGIRYFEEKKQFYKF